MSAGAEVKVKTIFFKEAADEGAFYSFDIDRTKEVQEMIVSESGVTVSFKTGRVSLYPWSSIKRCDLLVEQPKKLKAA